MDYVTFNLWESLFWIVLGILSFFLTRKIPSQFKKLSIFSGCNLIFFGISDFIESQFGSFFEPGMMWLFAWKIIGVGGLLYTLGWYVRIRLRK